MTPVVTILPDKRRRVVVKEPALGYFASEHGGVLVTKPFADHRVVRFPVLAFTWSKIGPAYHILN